MSKRYVKAGGVFVGSVVLLMSFQNCGMSGFEVVGKEKLNLISKTSVMTFASKSGNASISDGSVGYIPINGSETGSGTGSIPVGGGSTGSGSGTIPGGGAGSGSGSGGVPVGGGTYDGSTGKFYVESGDGTNVDIPVSYLCSSNSMVNFTRVVKDTATSVVILDGSVEVCNENQRDNILNFKKVKLSNECKSKLVDGKSYSIRFKDSKQTVQGYMSVNNSATFNLRLGEFVYDSKELRSVVSIPPVWVLYADNPLVAKGSDFTTGVDTRAIGDKDCDLKSSPLVVALGKNIKKIDLSAPTKGIKFDIAGLNALPVANDKKQISWFKKSMVDYYFIALPNRLGEVASIDELFGDNTYGPDHKFAANGYAALAKYDEDRDGYITSKDKVWAQLRLWQDKNLDGKGVGQELTTLDKHGIVSIDLNFDPNYSEYDQYGNETKMKSVVKMADGSLNLVFDLWFRPIGI